MKVAIKIIREGGKSDKKDKGRNAGHAGIKKGAGENVDGRNSGCCYGGQAGEKE